MTNNQLTETELFLRDIQLGYMLGRSDIALIKAMVAELQERRKAESEPVGWQYRVSAGPDTGWSLWREGKGEQFEKSYKVERRKIYAAPQPMPVMMKDHQTRELVNSLRDIAIEYHGTQQLRERIAHVVRAAIIQAGTLTNEDTKQRWIPLSERIPKRGDYLVTDGHEFDVQLFDGELFIPGFVWEDNVTHWMPLPAVPEVVKP